MKKTILKIYNFLKPNLEAYIWIFALVYLMFINPYELNHFSFCLFNMIGFDYCPGCGIGRSISMLYRGDIFGSMNMHPLGFFALAMIFYRIVTLLQKNKNKKVSLKLTEISK